MKKIIAIFLLSICFLLSSSKNTSATCDRKQPGSCSKIVCPVSNGNFCCDTQSECDAKKTTIGTSDSGISEDLWCDPIFGIGTKVNTAIGCVPVLDNNLFMSFLLKWAVGIGGGIAFLLIVYAGFMIMTSAGNPERLKAGQELLTSAISGLILLIFSVVILKIIGVDILGLDKFGFNQ